jgi:hypothetical protein
MRIIGYIDHPGLKITAFKMDNKLSVKFETGLYEQTYKFRESEGLKNFEDIKKLVDEPFVNNVLAQFERMHSTKLEAMDRNLPAEKADEFEEII